MPGFEAALRGDDVGEGKGTAYERAEPAVRRESEKLGEADAVARALRPAHAELAPARIADTHDVAPVDTEAERQVESLAADAIQHGGDALGRRSANPVGEAGAVAERQRAELAEIIRTGGTGHADHGGAGQPRQLHGEAAHAAGGALHQQRRARTEGEDFQRGVRGLRGTAKGGRLGERQGIRLRRDVGRRDGQILGGAAEGMATDDGATDAEAHPSGRGEDRAGELVVGDELQCLWGRKRYPDLLVSVEILDKWYTDHTSEVPEYMTETARQFTPDFVGPIEAFLTVPITKLMLLGDPAWIADLEGAMPEKFGNAVAQTRSDPHLLQVMNPRISKAGALAKVAGGLGIGADEVMAIGDAPNDIHMLQWAGLAVSPENGWEAARQVAHAIVQSNDADAVGVALRQFVLARD